MISAVQYLTERESRRRAAVFTAWDIISSSEGKGIDGGRRLALQQLVGQKESLAGLDLDNAVLIGMDLHGAEIDLGSFKDGTFKSCNLDGISLNETDLSSANFLDKCTIRGARLIKTNLTSTKFSDLDMTGSSFDRVEANADTTFNGATLMNVTFSGGFIDNVNFGSAILMHATFNGGVSLTGANFVRARMADCRFSRAKAAGTKLQKAELSNCAFEFDTDLRKADFGQAALERATFLTVKASEANFFGAFLTGSSFSDCDLRGSNFTSADLTGVTIKNCDIRGMIVTDAKISDPHMFDGNKGTVVGLPRGTPQ